MATASINFSANADEEVVGGGGGASNLWTLYEFKLISLTTVKI